MAARKKKKTEFNGYDTSTDAGFIKFFNTRFSAMDSARKFFEGIRKDDDAQIEAKSVRRDGVYYINIPLEATLCECSEGREGGKQEYVIEPLDEPDMTEIFVANSALTYHLAVGEFPIENEMALAERRIYGTCCMFTWITPNTKRTYRIKKGAKIEDSNALYDNNNYEEVIEENWILSPKFVPLRSFWMDERAIRNGFKHAKDCVMQENTTYEEVDARRGDNKLFKNIDKLSTGVSDLNPAYIRSIPNPQGEVIIQYYYNVDTKEYAIIGNYKYLLYRWKMLYKHGELPFKMAQYYKRHNCVYWIGIPERVQRLKIYKTEMWQNMLDNSRMSGSPIMLIWNDGEVSGQNYISPSKINIMEFTQGVDNVKFTQVPNNIASYQALLNEIDNQVIQDSGENLVASYQSPAQQLGTVEIIENNRATRVKSMDISRDFLISQVLQHTLDNITQFAWKLTKKETEETTSSGIKTIKIQNPVIIVPDVKITQKNKKIIKEEDEGNFGFFEFKEDMIKARYRVKVSTASNANMQKIMEKNSFTQYINNKVSLRNINPELIDQNELKNISRYMDLVWWYDMSILPLSNKDKIKQENLEKMEEIKQMIGMGTTANVPTQEDILNPKQLEQQQALEQQQTQAMMGENVMGAG